jgi:hypothetical protein
MRTLSTQLQAAQRGRARADREEALRLGREYEQLQQQVQRCSSAVGFDVVHAKVLVVLAIIGAAVTAYLQIASQLG